MLKSALLLGAALALGPGPAVAQNKSVKIGFVSTFSGPTAVMGNDMRNSFELALEHLGRKMGGVPVEVIYEDDQQRPDVGKQKTDKLIESDKVDFIVGYIWSNVLLASIKSAIDSKTFLITSNAGPHQIAGEQCSPYLFSTSWQNDQTPAAVGLYMNQKGVKTAFLLGPNYAAGKDMLAGVASTFKGTIVGQELTKWPDQLDFSVELAKARGAKPDAIFAFYPGASGAQFLIQYLQSGLKDQIPLYTAFTIDEITLPRQKEAAVGIPGAQEWVNDLPNEQNKRFVADYRKKLPGLIAHLLRSADLRRRNADQLGCGRDEGRPFRQGSSAQGHGKGRLRVRARQVQVRYQSHSDPELLLAGSHKGRGRLCAQNGRHHR